MALLISVNCRKVPRVINTYLDSHIFNDSKHQWFLRELYRPDYILKLHTLYVSISLITIITVNLSLGPVTFVVFERLILTHSREILLYWKILQTNAESLVDT